MVVQFFAAVSVHKFSILALISVSLSIIAFLPYIRDTARGLTRPDRASWLVWSVLGSIVLVSLLFEGAGHSAWFVGAQVGMTLIIFLQSIWLGAGSYLSRTNLMIFAAAAGGLGVWYVLETSVYTLAIVIGISALGALPTLRKAARSPRSETMSTWVLSGVAALCGAVSVGKIDFVQLAYPTYLLLLYIGIVWAMWMGHKAQARVQGRAAQMRLRAPLRFAPVFSSVRSGRVQPRDPAHPEPEALQVRVSNAPSSHHLR